MLRPISLFFILALLSSTFVSCSSVPLTGRTRVNFIPSSIVNTQSISAYNDTLKKARIAKNTPQALMVKRVGLRVARAAEDFVRENKIDMKFNWEFNLIESDQVNAWAMPGGKIAFYTGILKYAQSEDEVAAVMGHEVAHVLAKHGSERMSQQIGLQGLAIFTGFALKDSEYKNYALLAAGAISTYGIVLPFSRHHELEADRIGLTLMAKAGYNPEVAAGFWQKMSQSGGKKPPEIMSTHPADATRIRKIQQYLPEALIWYQPRR